MTLSVFKLEEYLAQYEFSAPYLLCCSDAESFLLQEILTMAGPAERTSWDNLSLGYTETYGLPALRKQITHNFYPQLDASNILCFAGAEEGVFCTLYGLCEPGDHVVVLTPCYQSLKEIPAIKGATVTCLNLREENQWRIDLDEIKHAIQSNTKCLIINFPHNPTGQAITPQELKDLVALCEAHNVWLFSDEVYRLLGTPNEGWASPAAELYPKAISLGVMSKSLGLAGLRIGWIACQNKDLLKKIEQIKHYTSICNSAPSELISLIALQNKDRILARNNQIVADNLQLLDKFMEQYQNIFEWVRPQGGCTGFVKYKGQESVETFTERLIKEKGVLLMPASIYNHPSKHFRIGFGRRNMREALERLEAFLKSS